MRPQISIIIPAFNAQETIAETLQSAIDQTEASCEILVLDDGSSDSTFETACAIRDARIRVVRSANRGVGAARNTGLRMADGEFACFLDSDDVLHPAFVRRMLDAIGEHSIAACGFEYCSPSLESSGWHHFPAASDWTIDSLLRFNQMAIGGLLFRIGPLLELDTAFDGAFPESTLAEDWEFLLRCARAGIQPAPTVPESLYKYRTRPFSRSTSWEPLWRAGLDLLNRWQHAQGALFHREWSIRTLARAAVGGRLALARTVFATLGNLEYKDLPCLSGALRWTLRRERLASEIGITLGNDDVLEAAIGVLTFLGVEPSIVSTLRSRAAVSDWGVFALSVARRLAQGEEIVVFGFGRNGSEAGRALSRAKVPFTVIDDRPDVAEGLTRIRLADLGPHHVVLVTPDDRDGIVRRLHAVQARFVTPETLDQGMAA